jgi:hypothetical protein
VGNTSFIAADPSGRERVTGGSMTTPFTPEWQGSFGTQ